jgi:purine-binding chemotaxis protein CheW
MEKTKIQIQKVVIFKLRGETFGVDINKVRDIHKLLPFTQIPDTPNYFEGVINLRGEIIPVINLSKKLNFPIIEDNNSTRIIVTDINKETIGLKVDQVKEVMEIGENDIKPAPAIITKKMNFKYIQGIVIRNEELVIIMDITKVLSSDEITGFAAATSMAHTIASTETETKDLSDEKEQEETENKEETDNKNLKDEEVEEKKDNENVISNEELKQKTVNENIEETKNIEKEKTIETNPEELKQETVSENIEETKNIEEEKTIETNPEEIKKKKIDELNQNIQNAA